MGKQTSQRQKIRGFTLIEMAVVITILSLAAAGGLAVASKSIRSQKREETLAKMDRIMEAIEAYVNNYGHLPCPSALDDGLGTEHSGFGIGANSGNCSEILDNATTGYRTASNVIKGFVPVYSLNLSPDHIFDAWDRRFTYVVDEDLTASANFMTETGDIQVLDNSAIQLTGTDGAAMVLISHGERGHGAYRLKGTTPSQIDDGLATPNYEDDNGDVNNPAAFDDIFRDVPFRNIDGGTDETDEPFDDFLMYRTQWQLAPEPALP